MKQPMKGEKVKDITKLRYPVLISPKVDGIRSVNENGVALTFTLKKVPNLYIQQHIGTPELHGFDGELAVGDPTAHDLYGKTYSGVMTKEGNPDFKFYIFDYFIKPPKSREHEPFFQRHNRLVEYVYEHRRHFGGKLRHWQHVEAESPEQLTWYEDTWLSAGYEGVMIRDPMGGYKFGRSTINEGIMLKLKKFEDSEAKILGFVEQNYNGNPIEVEESGRKKRRKLKENMVPKDTLGALLVQDVHSGVEFELGFGFTHDLAKEIWENQRKWKGKIVKYKYFPVGVKDKPRHASYLGLRDKRDF